MNDKGEIERVIRGVLRDQMAIDVPSADTDLVDGGYLDSLSLAELLSRLEAELSFRVRLEALDLDEIRTISGLAAMVSSLASGAGRGGVE